MMSACRGAADIAPGPQLPRVGRTSLPCRARTRTSDIGVIRAPYAPRDG